MRNVTIKSPSLSKETLLEIESRFQSALSYFKKRKGVLFASYCRFWERHAFVQQSLAKLLVQNGVSVSWLDGEGWRPYRPTLYFSSEHLRVRRLFSLPGQRYEFLNALTPGFQSKILQRERKRLGGEPVFWVQAGMNEATAERLPYVDVLSTFDDPYRCTTDSHVTSKSKLIVCQNSYTHQLLSPDLKSKATVMLPPVDMSSEAFKEGHLDLPAHFPKRVMGYIGSFFSEDYDLPLFENFVESFPDWGFLLMGRTDAPGAASVERLKRYSNFFHAAWVPREAVAGAWRKIDVTLLFYRARRTQDGAFPTKIVEALHFGSDAVSTSVPKTLDLKDFFPRCPFPERLKKLAVEPSAHRQNRILKAYDHFAYETHPKLHLARIAEELQRR